VATPSFIVTVSVHFHRKKAEPLKKDMSLYLWRHTAPSKNCFVISLKDPHKRDRSHWHAACWLPPYMCNLNPIELALHQTKEYFGSQNRTDIEGLATQWHMYFDCYLSFMQPLCSCIQQPCTLNKVQYPADRDVIKVTCFQKMTTQVLKSLRGQSLTVTEKVWGHFRRTFASVIFRTVYQPV
jgi:hypothetical protein